MPELALEATLPPALEGKIRAAQKAGNCPAPIRRNWPAMPSRPGAITAEELALLERRAALRDKVIRTDDFPQDFAAHEATPAAPHLKAAA